MGVSGVFGKSVVEESGILKWDQIHKHTDVSDDRQDILALYLQIRQSLLSEEQVMFRKAVFPY